jgi:hypothetical protein
MEALRGILEQSSLPQECLGWMRPESFIPMAFPPGASFDARISQQRDQIRNRHLHDLLLSLTRPTVPAKWESLLQLNVRYLDPTAVSDEGRIRGLFDRQTHIALKSAQGTGKTLLIRTELLRLLRQQPSLRVLWIACRRAYKNDVCATMRKFDETMKPQVQTSCAFKAYTEFPGTQQGNADMINTPRLVCTLESLPRLGAVELPDGSRHTPQFDLVILDETIELHSIFNGGTLACKRRTVHEMLHRLIGDASRVWAADADLTDETALPFMHALCGKPFSLLHNTRATICRRYLHYKDYSHARQTLVRLLNEGRKIVVACNTKKDVQLIAADPAIAALKLKVANLHATSSDEVRERYIRTTENWPELDLLTFSPVIGNGVDFNQAHFDCAFFFCSDRSTCARQAFQQLNRVRMLKLDTVHMHVSTHDNHEVLPITHESVLREVQERVTTMQRDYITQRAANGRPMRLDLEWDMDGYQKVLRNSGYNTIFVRNQLEVNISRSNFLLPLYAKITEAGGSIVQVDVTERATVRVMHKKAAEDLSEQELQAVFLARDILTDEDLEDTRRRVSSMCTASQARQPGDEEALEKAKIKKLYRIPLSDSTTMPSIDGFMEHYGNQARQDQCRNLLDASTGGAARITREVVQRGLKIEYAELATKTIPTHRIAEQLLECLGFRPPSIVVVSAAGAASASSAQSWTHPDLAASSFSPSVIWSNDSTNKASVIARLTKDAALRASVLSSFQAPPLREWWRDRQNLARKKNRWTVQPGLASDLILGYAKDGEAPLQKGSLLCHEVLVGARHLLRTSFGIGLATRGRQSKAMIDIDRRHWDEWAERTFGQPPQNPCAADWAMERSKTGEKSPAATAK